MRSGYPGWRRSVYVIVGLYERVGHLFYNQAFVDDPARPGFEFDLPKLDGGMAPVGDRRLGARPPGWS